MKYFVFFILALLLISGCKKDETLISGDISGNVKLINVSWNIMDTEPGTKVILYNDSKLIDSTVTDQYGEFLFSDKPYGRYDIFCLREGFIRSWSHSSFFHVGGYSPTIVENYLYEIPQFQIEIVAIKYDKENFMMILPITADGDTILPGYDYSLFRVFLSNSPDVSSENYTAIGKGIISDWSLDSYAEKVAIYGRFVTYETSNFNQVTSQRVYLVIYPIAGNQGYYPADYFKESLGPPSNVVSFDWNEISAK